MRILVYTDSRGQHTPRGAPVHDVFAKRLAKLPGVEAELVLCPMKWTMLRTGLPTSPQNLARSIR